MPEENGFSIYKLEVQRLLKGWKTQMKFAVLGFFVVTGAAFGLYCVAKVLFRSMQRMCGQLIPLLPPLPWTYAEPHRYEGSGRNHRAGWTQ